MSNWNQIRRDLLPLTRDGDAWVTTLMDFYGLPEVLGIGDAQEKVIALQERFAAEINHQWFIPFLALHEFEVWLFSAPDDVEVHFGKAHLADKLHNAVQEAGPRTDQPHTRRPDYRVWWVLIRKLQMATRYWRRSASRRCVRPVRISTLGYSGWKPWAGRTVTDVESLLQPGERITRHELAKALFLLRRAMAACAPSLAWGQTSRDGGDARIVSQNR